MLQIFAIIDDTSVMNFGEKFAIWFSENEGGGDQRPFGTFPKIHPFWRRSASLILWCTNFNCRIASTFTFIFAVISCTFTSFLSSLFTIQCLHLLSWKVCWLDVTAHILPTTIICLRQWPWQECGQTFFLFRESPTYLQCVTFYHRRWPPPSLLNIF